MSFLVCLASELPLEPLPNPHMKLLSVNEALEQGIEVPFGLLEDYEIDRDEAGMVLWSDIEPVIDMEKGIFDCPDPEDNFDIWPIESGDDLQSKKPYLAAVEWNRCTPARAEMLLAYIRRHMEKAPELELWHSWMGGGGETEYPPLVKKSFRYLDELCAADIEALCKSDVFQSYFENVDVGKQYCLLIRKDRQG